MPLLADHFLAQFCEEHGKKQKRMSQEALEALAHYPWPGNVREFRNFLESMVIFHDGEEIGLDDLPTELRQSVRIESTTPVQNLSGAPRSMADIERSAILETLQLTRGRRAEAAKVLGIGLRTLQRKLKDYKATGYVEE
jgi:two-component system response regulator HydG